MIYLGFKYKIVHNNGKQISQPKAQQSKGRVAWRNVYRIQDKFEAETKSELSAMRDDLARKEHFATVSEHLASHLVFRQVAQDKEDPMRHLLKDKVQMISNQSPKGKMWSVVPLPCSEIFMSQPLK